MSGLKWTRKSPKKIAEELESLGINVKSDTVARLLKKGRYSLKVNRKRLGAGNDPDRSEQFEYITAQRKKTEKKGIPIISVDTKKKELVGQFKNPGATYCQEATPVNDHDFRSLATAIASPYGIYETLRNRGFVVVGSSSDTSEFAVGAIEMWRRLLGKREYPNAQEILILADCGGSNGYRSRLWKSQLQEKLCDRHGIRVTVAHYPPGASKWNPIDHRLFSEIQKNWAGVPLTSFETILKYAGTTKTSTGLRVRARLSRKKYKKGIRVSDQRMAELNIVGHDTFPQWNYTISPMVGPQ